MAQLRQKEREREREKVREIKRPLPAHEDSRRVQDSIQKGICSWAGVGRLGDCEFWDWRGLWAQGERKPGFLFCFGFGLV